MQVEIINRADAQDAYPREPRPNSIHEGTACGTEVVGHGVVQADRMILAKSFEIVATAKVLQISVGDDEIGREHGSRDFVAVITVADKAVYQPWPFSWLRDLEVQLEQYV